MPDGRLLSDWLEIERLARAAPRSHPGLKVTVVRPAPSSGRGVDSILTRHFEAPRLLVVRDSRPRWQFCHVDDLVSALELAALEKVNGAVAVGCDGWLEQEDVELVSGPSHRAAGLAGLGTAERLHRRGLIPARRPATCSTSPRRGSCPAPGCAKLAGGPTYDNPTALGLLLEQASGHRGAVPPGGQADATIGAGAAVAVVGTAALVRIARQKRGG